jgi:hypothetical protein
MKCALSFAISTVLTATFSENTLAKEKRVTLDAQEKTARKAGITGFGPGRAMLVFQGGIE